MTTLIAVYGSDGCEGRCDARCYEATGPDCDCCCQGANHGKGRQRAEANVRALAETWIAKWQAEHGAGRAEVSGQMSLPWLED